MENFKLRASAAGKIMTGAIGLTDAQKRNFDELSAKEKRTVKQQETLDGLTFKKDNPELSQTTKSFVQEWYKSELYNCRKEINSKYLSKGLEMEDAAIDFMIAALDINFAMKNEKRFDDEFFTGEPDLIVDGVVYDTKCSWDCFTFSLFEDSIPNMDYFYQLQVYMYLTGCKKAVLGYVLMNTPEHLTWEQQHYYSNIDNSLRVKTFEFEFDSTIIDEMKMRIELCRNYLETIKIK